MSRPASEERREALARHRHPDRGRRAGDTRKGPEVLTVGCRRPSKKSSGTWPRARDREPDRRCDVLIVGGGAVGSALACALAELPLDLVLVEAHEVRTLEQPSFDQRVTALANGSQQILAGLKSVAARSRVTPRPSARSISRSEAGSARRASTPPRKASRRSATRSRTRRSVECCGSGSRPRRGSRTSRRRSMRALDTARRGAVGDESTRRASVHVHARSSRRGRRRAVGGARGARRRCARHDYAQRAIDLQLRTEAPPRGARSSASRRAGRSRSCHSRAAAPP